MTPMPPSDAVESCMEKGWYVGIQADNVPWTTKAGEKRTNDWNNAVSDKCPIGVRRRFCGSVSSWGPAEFAAKTDR